MVILYILGGVLVLAVFYLFAVYNRFQKLSVRINAAIQEIGNQLKRQASLIPNLEEAARGYMEHEQEIFGKLAEARKMVSEAVSSGQVGKMAEAGAKANEVLGRFFALVESNPEIKAEGPIKELMDNLRDSADKVMYSRRLLIELSAQYNTMLATIPTNIVGNLFGFKEKEGLATPDSGEHVEVSEEETKTPEVNFG